MGADFVGQPAGDAVGPLAGGRDGGVTGAELAAQAGRSDPAGHGATAARQDGAEQQASQSRCRARVEDGGEFRKPVAKPTCNMRGCHGRVRPGEWLFGNTILSDGPAFVYLRPFNGSCLESRGKYRR